MGKVFPAQRKAWIRAQKARESGTSMELAGVWPPPQAWGGWQCLCTATPPPRFLCWWGSGAMGAVGGAVLQVIL